MKTPSDAKPEAQTTASQPTKKCPLSVSLLCIVMWMSALVVFVSALILVVETGITWTSVLVAAAAFLIAIAGIGLWRMRKWGVMLFALFLAIGFTGSFIEFMLDRDVLDIFYILSGVLGACGITAFVVYLWRIADRLDKQG